MLSTTSIIVLSCILYAAAYLAYGRFLERKIVRASDFVETPAVKFRDGVDYVPTNKFVLYGHHFASIAGAGPIIGPALALAWGWLPTLIWIWLGNIFIGAVHDYLSLMSSIRYGGRSIAWIAGELMSRRSFYTFNLYISFALILVLAVFMVVIAVLFSKIPGSATAALLLIISAVITGFLMYRTRLGFIGGTVVGLILLIISIIVGIYVPIRLTFYQWLIVLAIYCIIASSLPVWILLQPRDYLNAYVLWASLVIGGLAALLAFKPMELPAVTSLWGARVVAGAPSPFWPAVVLIVACGALSGFHSVVASGTTSKQLARETHGLFVAYGGMLTEGFLATMVTAILGAFAIEALAKIGVSKEILASLTNPEAVAASWVSLLKAQKWFVVIPYGYAEAVHETLKLPFKAMLIFAALWLTGFALTTLDTATRLGRIIVQELVHPLKDRARTLYSILSNRWITSTILIAIALALAWTAAWKILWPAFAGMNQLLAALALFTVSTWVTTALRVSRSAAALVLIPTMFLWVTVTVALIWFEAYAVPIYAAKNLGVAIAVGAVTAIGLALNIMLLADFIKTIRRG